VKRADLMIGAVAIVRADVVFDGVTDRHECFTNGE
jgi:hypothetical protein